MLESVFAAEKEGYDAVAIGCSLDPIIDELKEVVDIPVLALASLEVKGPKEADIPSLGKATKIFFEGGPALYETVENTASRHVGNIIFRANPRYRPNGNYFDRCKYCQNEEAITEANIGTAINSLLGEGSGTKMRVERSICNESDFCAMVIEKDGAASAPLPDGKKPSAKKASIFEVLEEQQRSVADQLLNSVMWFAGADLSFYKAVEKEYGLDKAQDFCSQVWTSYVDSNLKRAMEAMRMPEIKSVSTLGRIAIFINIFEKQS